jgi:hypothetical protein
MLAPAQSAQQAFESVGFGGILADGACECRHQCTQCRLRLLRIESELVTELACGCPTLGVENGFEDVHAWSFWRNMKRKLEPLVPLFP